MKNKMLRMFLILSLLCFGNVFAQKKHFLRCFPQDKIMVVAHRGDWQEAQQNYFESFLL